MVEMRLGVRSRAHRSAFVYCFRKDLRSEDTEADGDGDEKLPVAQEERAVGEEALDDAHRDACCQWRGRQTLFAPRRRGGGKVAKEGRAYSS